MGCSSSLHVQGTRCQPQQTCKGSSCSFHECYLLGRVIGQGAFAHVRSAICRPEVCDTDPIEVAVKIVDIRSTNATGKPNSRTPLQRAHDEIDCWTTVGRHSNVVDLYEAFNGRCLSYMVMERCPSDLYGHLAAIREFNERSLGAIFLQMLRGVAHVHSKMVIHRDIKATNFLVGGDDGRTVKLCDFGLSVKLPKYGDVGGVYGSIAYMCPEMLKEDKYNEKADMWSVGVVVYVLLFGQFPYMAGVRSKMKMEILDGAPPGFKPGAMCADVWQSDSVVNFVRSLLERDPNDRPSALQALQSDFLVAIEQHTHMHDGDLPCLHRVLRSAKKVGAFSCGRSPRDVDIDNILGRLQVAAHGSLASDFLSTSCQSQDSHSKVVLEPSKIPVKTISNQWEAWQESSTCTTRATSIESLSPQISASELTVKPHAWGGDTKRAVV